MNLQPPSTNMVCDSFDNLLKAVNTHVVAERFAFVIKCSKKLKK